MPISLRPEGKVSKIVEDIKGKPDNGNTSKNPSKKEEKLVWEESKRF